ncbi:MAG: hypothetical protein PF569_01640 [Candidatus Woesearchaeota archaeon]|jgi:Zn finger protein HypA/HybF involved in hydrogenase expression|nr:hypothetical protein [Candidatus Woesearchaeota archaeon]
MADKKKDSAEATKVIKALEANLGSSNEDQGKLIQIMKGLAFSDAPEANKFMKEVNDFTTKLAKKMGSDKKESILKLSKDYFIEGSIIKKGTELNIIEASTATAKCPTCGSKYLKATKYCVKCKKKVKESSLNESGDDDFDIGDEVILTSEAIANYGSKYSNKIFTIESVAYSEKDHFGYDNAMEGMGLYDLVDFPNSVYAYELEYAN